MLYLTCTTITSIGLAHYGISRAKDWVSVKCGTRAIKAHLKGHTINRILHSWPFHIKFMKLAEDLFHKFHMK